MVFYKGNGVDSNSSYSQPSAVHARMLLKLQGNQGVGVRDLTSVSGPRGDGAGLEGWGRLGGGGGGDLTAVLGSRCALSCLTGQL